MSPVARDRSVVINEGNRTFACNLVNYAGVPVLCTTGSCCLYSITTREDNVRATIVNTSSRSIFLPGHTRVLVRTLYSLSNVETDLWAVSDPYYRRLDACSTYDLIRVVTFSDDENFNKSTAKLTEMHRLDEKTANGLRQEISPGRSSAYLKCPLFFRRQPNRPLPSYYSRRNTVWDRVAEVKMSSLQSVVTMQSDRQCGVYMDGIVVLVPQRECSGMDLSSSS